VNLSPFNASQRTENKLKELLMNKSKSNSAPRTSAGALRRITAAAAIFLMQANLALASGPAVLPQAPAAQTPAPADQTPAAAPPAATIQSTPQQIPFGHLLHHSYNPINAYRGDTVPAPNLANSVRLGSLMRDGKLYLSLHDAIDLALENNLDLVIARFNLPIAQTDIMRTQAGASFRGVNTGVVSGTPGGTTSAGGGGTGAGGTSSGAGGAGSGASGIVSSTLGTGSNVSSFDPYINATSYVDHTSAQLINEQIYGVSVLHDNTVLVNANYQQSFPTGTGIQAIFNNNRQTFNSPNEELNPLLSSYFQFGVQQQLLAGFGLGPNMRFLRIARTNQKIVDVAFKAQIIATVDQIANIYWDLVAAYEDEQVQERSVSFASETLDTSRKQLQLQAIAEMDVLKAQGDLATRQQDLAVAKSTLELQELYMKNAITRSLDDPVLEDMPIVPTDHIAAEIQPDSQPIQETIGVAMKNRTELQESSMDLKNRELSRKTARNALLPQLTAYGFYAGTGYGGTPNPIITGQSTKINAPAGWPGAVENAFNYSSPEYQLGFQLSIPLRNRVAKADQYRTELEYRQSQVYAEELKKRIVIEVRSARYTLEQDASRVDAARTARDLAQKTLDINKQEQKLGAGSNQQTLTADRDLGVAESALVAAETAYEKARIEVKRATGALLEDYGISIEDAKAAAVQEASHPQ
jgi:outer membrane protein TolC